MHVILREDVDNLGKRGDVVRVADGYARNFLLPQQLAYRFTEGVQRQVETEARSKARRDEQQQVEAVELARRLQELQVIRFKRRVGETGSLYGSVTNADIAERLGQEGIAVDRRQVRLEEPIKRPGTHRVTLHVFRDLDVELAVEVEPGDEDAAS
jgi:large subunit ribosomal protein L9